MKILVAGDWHSELHEEPLYRALCALGHDAHRFAWHQYFGGKASSLGSAFARFQNKYLLGPIIDRINANLVAQATQLQPDLLFIYRGTHIKATTIQRLRETVPGLTVAGYNNDDPFAPNQPQWLWRHFKAALREYDVALAYRQHNMDDFKRHGARCTYLLRSWFVPERNHPVTLNEEDMQAFGSEVVFIGHYENDGRLQLLEQIARAGHRLRLFGHGSDWDPVLMESKWLRSLAPIRLVWGEDYNKALCGAKIALCFFSRLNRDTYTRRCFEIPATGTLLLSEHSDDLATLFAEGREADFFRSGEELLAKLRLYIEDEPRRRRVAAAGMARVHADGHDVKSRMKTFLEWLESARLPDRQYHAA